MSEKATMFGLEFEDFRKLPEHIQSHLISQNWSLASAEHAARRQALDATEAQAWAAAHSVIKLLMALNAGAIIAILAFVGATLNAQNPPDIRLLVGSVIAFGFGVAAAVACAFSAFFTANHHIDVLDSRADRFEQPYVVDGPETSTLIGRANRSRLGGIIAAMVSMGCATVGGACFLTFATHDLGVKARLLAEKAAEQSPPPAREVATPSPS